MSQTAIVVQGTVKADGTLELAEKLNVPAGRVQVVIQPLPELSSDPFLERLQAIWAGQRAREHVPRSVEGDEAERRAIRDEMEVELQDSMRLQEESREARRLAHEPRERDE